MGEIGVRAAVNGRELTLAPLMDVSDIVLPRRRVESMIPCGFRIGWIDGTFEDDGEWSFSLAAGAGCGSRWLTLEVKSPDGTTRSECVDMGELAKTWLDAIVGDGPSPEVSRG